MSPTAIVVAIREPGRSPLHLVVGDRLEVGRDCTGVNLTDPMISRRHLSIEVGPSGVVVSDLGSRNGSSVGGRPLAVGHHLGHEEIVEFGNCTLAIVPPPRPVPHPSLTDSLRTTSIGLLAETVINGGAVVRPRDAGTVTIVFSDIEGSTAKAVELGDVRWYDALSRHNQIMRTMLERHGGVETNSLGDGFMMCFRSARSALAFIVDAQRALVAFAASYPEEGVRVRAGLHTGEAIAGDDGDLFGRHVVMASRIADQARGGEILASSLVREIVEPRGDVSFGSPRTVSLKGLGDGFQVHPVVF